MLLQRLERVKAGMGWCIQTAKCSLPATSYPAGLPVEREPRESQRIGRRLRWIWQRSSTRKSDQGRMEPSRRLARGLEKLKIVAVHKTRTNSIPSNLQDAWPPFRSWVQEVKSEG